MVSSEFIVSNRLGLHARAAARMVKTANQFHSEIRIRCGDREVNGKSIMGILTLAAIQGSVITLIAEGPDEEAAIEALGRLVGNKFEEE